MNALEQQLNYPLGETLPAPGQPLEVAPGIHWVRMPLPFALDHINLWLLRDEIDGQAGWTIIDCGIADATIRGLWEQVFDRHLDGLPVLRVLVTHFHPITSGCRAGSAVAATSCAGMCGSGCRSAST